MYGDDAEIMIMHEMNALKMRIEAVLSERDALRREVKSLREENTKLLDIVNAPLNKVGV